MVRRDLVAVVLVCASVVVASAGKPLNAASEQQKPEQQASPVPVSLRIKVTLIHSRGSEVLKRTPLEVVVGSGGNAGASLLTEVPVLQPLLSADRGSSHVTWRVREIGQQFNCSVREVAQGRYRVDLRFTDTRLSTVKADAQSTNDEFRRSLPQVLNAQLQAILANGQVTTHTVAEDTTTGDRFALEIALTELR